jgi:DNA-binding transcriptional LysR family regulator
VKIKQLETLVWIVRLGSFSAAADQLNSTQSTVSTRIHDLERDLGISLFDRTQYRASLTSKGRELIPYAERIIEIVADAKSLIGDPKAVTSIIRIGAAESIAITWLPKLVVAIKDKYPNLRLEIDLNLANNLLGRLHPDSGPGQ